MSAASAFGPRLVPRPAGLSSDGGEAQPRGIGESEPRGTGNGTTGDLFAPDLPLSPTRNHSLDEMVTRVAPSRVSVLITGETGVGKDILARRIHLASPRANQPFITVNCAAFCETLLDSELFGHQRGAFTGADRARAGLIEAADGGTVFLDELGELSAAAQAKLLRVIETRFVTRVGSTQTRHIDVRFLAATHRDLDAAIRLGLFRADLLYRVEGIRLHLSPLRARRGEIVPAANAFLDELAVRDGIARPTLTIGAERVLVRHAWPGNFRELRNAMDRAALVCEGGRIEPEDLHMAGIPPTADAPAVARVDVVDEAARISSALGLCAGNQTRAAKLLGISRRTLIARLEKHGIARPRARRLRPVSTR